MNLTREEYEERKALIGDLKSLAKSEKEQIFRILKNCGEDFSENSNGIFFDVVALKLDTFTKMTDFLKFCKAKVMEQDERVKEMNELRSDLHEDETSVESVVA